MATVTRSGTGVASGTDATTYTTGLTATTADALIVAFVYATGQLQATPTFASGSFTFSLLRRDGGTHSMYVFVSNSLDDGVSKAFTFTTTANSTGCAYDVFSVTGMTRTGTSAIRQSNSSAVAASNTANTSFPSAPLTSNACMVAVANATNPINSNQCTPTGWTNRVAKGYGTPATGYGVSSIDSGFTATLVQATNTSATAGRITIIELDTSVPASSVFPPVIMRSGGIIGA